MNPDKPDPDIPFSIVDVDESDPTHVKNFHHKDHYPDEVTDQWDEIRSGKEVLVDDSGNIVDSLQEAYYLLHPAHYFASLPSSLTGLDPSDVPPVTWTLVGEPEDDIDAMWGGVMWIDPDTEHLMIIHSDGDGERTTTDLTESRQKS